MGLLGKSQFLAFLVHSLQAPSIRTGPTQDLWTPARLDCFLENCHRAPSELLARGGGLHHHDPAMEAKNGVLCFASTSSRTQPAEELHKRGPSPLIRVATAAEFSTERLLRIRRRNIRFLCASRRNRKRGLLPPAKAAAAEAAEKWNAGEEAFLRRSLELKDPLVNEAPVRRWRTQWFPSFARASLVPLMQAASRCDAIVEVRDARLPLLSRCNLRVLHLPKPKVVVLTHADQASPTATRRWQRHFRRESREAAALELHSELTRARTKLKHPALFRLVSEACPLAPRLPYLFVDARQPAAVVRLQRLLRSLVRRHCRYKRELEAFRSLCKQAFVAAAAAGIDSSTETAKAAQVAASLKNTADEAGRCGKTLSTRTILQQKKPLRILIVGLPNVGKSKIANSLVGRKVARSYRWPGTTQSINVHRQPVTLARQGDMSRLFDVVDTPGFIPVYPGKNSKKKRLTLSQQGQLQRRLGTASRQRQLDLGIFFDFNHPPPSPDELALLGAFHLMPHSCLFTIEEAAVALGDAFFRMKDLVPGATDFDRVMTRYKIDPLSVKHEMNMGVQLLLMLAEQRHHSNEGAAAQRLLSDFTQGYLGRHTFELPPVRHPPPRATSTEMTTRDVRETGEDTRIDKPDCVEEHLVQPAFDGVRGTSLPSTERRSSRQVQTDEQTVTVGLAASRKRWTMRRHGDRISFVLEPQNFRQSAAHDGERTEVLQSEEPQATCRPRLSCSSKRGTEGVPGAAQSQAEKEERKCSASSTYGRGIQQQSRPLAPGWLEGW